MASNKLFEAAAEILAQSKSAAPAMPTQKLDGEVTDLGGPTPQDGKPTDDSNKIDTTKGAKSAAAPTTKPSAASAKMEETESEEEVIAEKSHDMEENQIAIESGLRAEMTEDFIAGLRNLFAEHYIDVPAEKVDLVDELAGKVEELETKLNEEIERGVSYAKALVESRKKEITAEVCEGLIATQVEKIKTLAESVEFSTEDEYKEKLETIRENYFPSGVKKASEAQLQEEVTDGTEKQAVSNDPYVAAVAQAISKTKI